MTTAKKVGWVSFVGIAAAVVAILTTLGWAPWKLQTQDAAAQEHMTLQRESGDALRNHERLGNTEHGAMLQRIDSNQQELKSQREEVNEQYQKLDRRLWQVLQEVRK